MDKFKAALTRKFGPLPAYAWALIAGGALYFYRRHSGSLVPGGGQGGPQQDIPTFYGPYGQQGGGEIQGGSGTGPGDNVPQTQPGPPVIIVNPQQATSTGGKPPQNTKPKPRTVKPKPQHKAKQPGKVKAKPTPKRGHPVKQVSHSKPTSTHKTTTNHNKPAVQRPRHPATTHAPSTSRPRTSGGASVRGNARSRH